MTVSRFTNLGVPTGVSKFSSSLLPPGNPFVVERDANRFGAFIPPVLTIPTPSPSSLVKSTSSSSLALEYAEDNASESDDSSFADFSSSSSESSSVLPVLLLFSRLRRRRRRRFRCSFLFLNVFWCWVVVSTFFFSSRPSSNPWWSSWSWSSCFAVQYHSTAVRESKPIATSATAALVARLVVVRLGSILLPLARRVSLSLLFSLTLSLSSNARSRFQFESPK